MNFPFIMRNLAKRIETFFVILLQVISIPLTRKMRTSYGKLLGTGIYLISKKRREITYDNLRHAFPEKSEKEIKSIGFKSFLNLGITFAELFALKHLSDKQIEDYIQFPYLQEIKEVYSRKEGIIFLSAHMGNWELMAYSFAYFSSIPMTIIVKPLSNPYADTFLNKIRTYRGNKIVTKFRSAFEIVKCLRNKEAVALLGDQAAQRDKDLYIDFFGRPASTYESPAQLALKLKVPIIIGFNIRQPDGTYICKTSELIHTHLSDNEEGIIELTKMHVKILEDYIRKYPEQWLWQHRRWKHIPNKENQ